MQFAPLISQGIELLVLVGSHRRQLQIGRKRAKHGLAVKLFHVRATPTSGVFVGDDRRSERLDFTAAVAILAAKHLPFCDNHPTLLKGSDSRCVARLTDLCKTNQRPRNLPVGSQTTAVP